MTAEERKERMELHNQIMAAINDLDGLREIADNWDEIKVYLKSKLSPNAYQVICNALNAVDDAIVDYIAVCKLRIEEIEAGNETDD